jgi:hypothetical protein
VRRLTLNSTTLFEERITDLANGFGQKIAPLLFRPETSML